jgi:hypothetical protein
LAEDEELEGEVIELRRCPKCFEVGKDEICQRCMEKTEKITDRENLWIGMACCLLIVCMGISCFFLGIIAVGMFIS